MALVYPQFRINGQSLPDPTSHRWIQPPIRGEDGFGNVRHESFWSFEIFWDFLTQEEYSDVFRIFLGHYTSGGATSLLPGHLETTYQFRGYSGTILDYPTVGDYLSNHVKDVRLIIKKIRVF